MADPITIISISSTIASFIKKYWHILLVLLFIVILLPVLIFSVAINVLFPQVDREGFKLYKSLTQETDISWDSLVAYDVVRLDNYLKDNKPNESVFDLLKVNFKEYEIIETEKEISKIVDGQIVTETIIEKEYVVIRELEANGYTPIKELLNSLAHFPHPFS